MFNSILAESNGQQWVSFVILGVLIVAIVVMFIFSGRRRKKQEQEAKNLIESVKPGNKVKTIGGICGIVVEVDEEENTFVLEVDATENTFVLETGTELSGKCFIKFDRQAIYQTDAVAEKTEEKKTAEELPAETPEEVAENIKPEEETSPEEKKH